MALNIEIGSWKICQWISCWCVRELTCVQCTLPLASVVVGHLDIFFLSPSPSVRWMRSFFFFVCRRMQTTRRTFRRIYLFLAVELNEKKYLFCGYRWVICANWIVKNGSLSFGDGPFTTQSTCSFDGKHFRSLCVWVCCARVWERPCSSSSTYVSTLHGNKCFFFSHYTLAAYRCVHNFRIFIFTIFVSQLIVTNFFVLFFVRFHRKIMLKQSRNIRT